MSCLVRCPSCGVGFRLEMETATLRSVGVFGAGLSEPRPWLAIHIHSCGGMYQILESPVLDRDAWCATRSRALGHL